MKTYVVALLVAVGILAGFYGGFKVGQNNVSANTGSKAAANSGTRTGTGGGNFGGGGGRNFGTACPSPGAATPAPGTNAVARGSITNLSSTSMTITTASCEIKVEFGNTVQVSKTVPGSTSDLQDNMTVTVIGTRQSDGSVKATTIQIGNGNAIIGGGGGGQSPTGAGG